MFPAKRHRGSPSSEEEEAYELSMRRQHHAQRQSDYPDFPQQNRSVRGPSVAPTSRHDVDTACRSRSHRDHIRRPQHPNDGQHGASETVGINVQPSRSWRGDQPEPRLNHRGSDEKYRPDKRWHTEATHSWSRSLPGIPRLYNREAITSRHSEDVFRHAPGSMGSTRRCNSDTEKPMHQPHPGLTQFPGLVERFRSSMGSDTTSPASTEMRDSIGSNNSDDRQFHLFSTDDASQDLELNASFTRGRADSSSSNASLQSTASLSCDASSAFPLARTVAKTSRYLREIDRRNILQRIKNGEKQATLAKEYQVSRAAICNLNKHRDVVLSRKDENPLAKHPKKPRAKTDDLKSKSNPKAILNLNDVSPGVHEVRSRAATVLMTSLLDPQTPMTDFKRSAYRLLRLVVEEAVSLVPLKRIQVEFADDAAVEGFEIADPFCGVAMKVSGGGLLLHVFCELEPQRATGSICVTSSRAVDAELPPALANQNVFLFELVMASSEVTSLAIERLIAEGAKEEKIRLVTLSVSVPVAEAIMTKFPHIKIVTAKMDRLIPRAGVVSRTVIHCLTKRFLDSFARSRNASDSGKLSSCPDFI